MAIEQTLHQTLVESLQQRTAGRSGRELARQLGIASSTWSRIVRGHKQIGFSTAQSIRREFPELEGLVVSYLQLELAPREQERYGRLRGPR